jgi:O-antigen/teichoic acid export membrane protein
MALFNAANVLRIIVLFVPGLSARVGAPLLCRLQGREDSSGFQRVLGRLLAVNSALAVLVGAVLWALAPWLLSLFGPGYGGGLGALGLLLVAGAIETIAVALYQPLYAHGRIWTQFAISSIWGLSLVGAARVWAPRYGAAGLSAAYLASWVVAVGLYGWVAREFLQQSDDSPRRGPAQKE